MILIHGSVNSTYYGIYMGATDNQTTSYLSELTLVITTLLTQHNYHTDRLATNMVAAEFKHHNTHTK